MTVALAAACDVGEVDIGGTTTPDAPGAMMMSAAKVTAFTNTVTPIVMAKGCTNTAACHTVFPPVLDAPAMLVARYYAGPSAINILITKDTVAGTPGLHPSPMPYLTDTEKTTVAAWIDMP